MPDPGQSGRPSVVSPGNHDGVHLGHRALLARARARAEAVAGGADVAALLFHPHPAAVVAPERAPALLTTVERRAALLEEAGASRVEVQPFDHAFSRLTPEAFVREVLVGRLRAVGLVVGPDFRFGRGRSGDVDGLRALGAAHGFTVEVVDPVVVDGERVSSTRVRAAVTSGDVAAAARLLDRVHEVTGVVVRGDGRGRTLGFPTANLAPEPTLLPADGVYAVSVRNLDAPAAPTWWGVANLGTRPTFGAGRALEVHLLDASVDLYGARVRVGFGARVRAERRFDGVDALRAQIASDVAEARAALAAIDPRAWRCL